MWIDFQQRFSRLLTSWTLWIQPPPAAAKDNRRYIQHHNHQRSLLQLLLLLSFALSLTSANFRPRVKVISGNSISSFRGKGKILENSPIFYLNIGSRREGNKNSPLSSSLPSSPSPSLSPLSSSSLPVTSLMLARSVGKVRRVNSNLYQLPLSFVSNAKPVETKIIQGIIGKKKKKPLPGYHQVKGHSTKLGGKKHSSKVFYLPTKFVSNGKPVKPILFSSTKVNNFGGKRKFHHYYPKRLKYGSDDEQF